MENVFYTREKRMLFAIEVMGKRTRVGTRGVSYKSNLFASFLSIL